MLCCCIFLSLDRLLLDKRNLMVVLKIVVLSFEMKDEGRAAKK